MPPQFTALQHIALKVRDIEKSMHFYVDVLGFRVIERHGSYEKPDYPHSLNFLTCTNLHHVINLVSLAPESRPEKDGGPVVTRSVTDYGPHHFAFQVEDKAAFDAWESHLRKNGVEIVSGPVVHSPTYPGGDGLWGENRAMYFPDPDGHTIEIFCDMAELDPDGQINKEWQRARIAGDGLDPAEVAHPRVG